MISNEQLRKLAMSYPEVTEEPHFDKTSFRVNKKIFCTIDALIHRACVKLSLSDQDIFSTFDTSIVYPIPNKWGQQGWTFIELKKIKMNLLREIVKTAYCHVAPKKLSALLD